MPRPSAIGRSSASAPVCSTFARRRVEVRVVRDHLPRPAEHREENALGRTPLVRRDDVLEREQRLYRLDEPIPRGRAGVALVAVLDGRPLVARHRASPGIGEEVDQHLRRRQPEEIEVDRLHACAPLLLRRQPQWLHGVDPERLDDGADRQLVGGFGGAVLVAGAHWSSYCKDAGSPRTERTTWATEDAAGRRSSVFQRHSHCFARSS
jgi:hypothetical protein